MLGKDFSNEFNMTKRFGSDGGFLRFKLENNINETENEDFINSNTEIFGTNSETIDRNQFTTVKKIVIT